MAGTFRTDNIGRYLSDMQKTINLNDTKALADVDPDFNAMLADFAKLKDNSFIKLPSPLDQQVPRLAKEAGFAKILTKFEKTRSATAHRELVANATKRIQKVLNSRRPTAQAHSFIKMQGNRNKMIESCLPMVYAMAKHYLNRSKNERVTIDDLVQSGNLGLVIAADKYLTTPIESDAKPKAKFSTYAYFWIKKYVTEESYRQSTLLSGTNHDVWHAANNTNTIGSDPFSDTSYDDRKESQSIWDKYAAKQSTLSEPERDLKEIQASAKDLFKDLSKEEKRVLFLTYGIDTPTGSPYTFEEAGKMVGKSKATVSRMIQHAMFKIQNRLKSTAKAKDIIATLSLLQGVDLSKVEDFTMASTY